MADLTIKACPECDGEAIEVINQDTPHIRRGWHCMDCGYFDAALGNERRVAIKIPKWRLNGKET